MSLVPLIDVDQASPAAREVLERGRSSYGQLLTTWRALANCPDIFVAYLPFLSAVAGPGELDQRVKELAAVEVGIVNHCRYTVSHRCRSAIARGITVEELSALARGELDGFSEEERLGIELAKALTLDPPAHRSGERPHAVAEELIERARAAFTPPALVELVLGIGVWNALSRFHRAMGFELDMDPPPPEVDAVL